MRTVWDVLTGSGCARETLSAPGLTVARKHELGTMPDIAWAREKGDVLPCSMRSDERSVGSEHRYGQRHP
jgi:hypothetical protein